MQGNDSLFYLRVDFTIEICLLNIYLEGGGGSVFQDLDSRMQSTLAYIFS